MDELTIELVKGVAPALAALAGSLGALAGVSLKARVDAKAKLVELKERDRHDYLYTSAQLLSTLRLIDGALSLLERDHQLVSAKVTAGLEHEAELRDRASHRESLRAYIQEGLKLSDLCSLLCERDTKARVLFEDISTGLSSLISLPKDSATARKDVEVLTRNCAQQCEAIKHLYLAH